MHATAHAGFVRYLTRIRHDIHPAQDPHVLDLGGADVNGTVHDVLPQIYSRTMLLDVLDITDGPGVTVIGDARTWRPPIRPELPYGYDLVISTGLLEHVEGWPHVITTAHESLRPGGWFVGTAASTGFHRHGMRGAPVPADDEWYENVDPVDLHTELVNNGFTDVVTEYDPGPHDVYWHAMRPPINDNGRGD